MKPAVFARLAGLACFTLLAAAAHAATITIVNGDGAGEGFNDPTPVPAVGGNPATTLGGQRLYVFQYAANLWGSILPSAVEIRVHSSFNALTCNATSVILGSTTIGSNHSNFAGAPLANTMYVQALANKLAGSDLSGLNDMTIVFNLDVDNATCLGTSDWYYGVDGNEGSDVELLPVVFHEIGHGLGFTSQVNSTTGVLPSGVATIYSRFTYDNTLALYWSQMSDAQRLDSFNNTGAVVWDGAAVTAQAQAILEPSRILTITAPAAIAGTYRAGTAGFGPDVSSPIVTASVVLANDGVADPSTSNACTPLVNAVAGMIVLIDRGDCTFTAKALTAQNAGAVGVIIADSSPGLTALELGGTEPAVTIPTVGVTQSTGALIKAQLGAGVVATIGGLHPTFKAGANDVGKVQLYAPPAIAGGSSISHWDLTALPNLLMEPSITPSLYAQVDLTRHLFRDIGWFTGSTITGVPEAGHASPRIASAPNPFDGATTLSFALARAGQVELDVYGVDGRHVRRLVGSSLAAGPQSVTWDGSDDHGHRVAAGVYVFRLRSGEGEWTGRAVRLR